MSNYQKLSTFIWSVADDALRGLFKPHEYGQIILPFTVLRRLDSIIEPKKDDIIRLHNEWKDKTDFPTPIILNKLKIKFYNNSKYDLKRLTQDPQNIYKNFQNYLSGFSENIDDIIENFQIDKHIEKLNKNDRLFILIEKFSSADLSPSQISNYEMGQLFEELLRLFSEMSNETSGEHYTPRDVVKLLVELIFAEEKNKLKKSKVVSLFDCCCGSGGMLSLGKEWLQKNIDKKIKTFLFGQELNPETFALCKADMLITDEDPENIKYGNSLDNDHFKDKKFQYMITNPPYGISWKSEENFIKNENASSSGRFIAGLPRVSDGQLLFLQHLISKMDPNGSKIGIVFNASPNANGDAGSGESDIRKWVIENDLLETIVSLPGKLFFNTGIITYFWIISNVKRIERKGKVQIIDASKLYEDLRKNLNKKTRKISEEKKKLIIDAYLDFKENKISKILNNDDFGYTRITIENSTDKKKKKIDYERVPFKQDINDYFIKEVKKHFPDSVLKESGNKIGYEINTNKYFYSYENLRNVDEIITDIQKVKDEIKKLESKIE